MKQTTKIFLVLGSVMLTAISIYTIFKIPRISAEEIDHLNRTARLEIGNQTVTFKENKEYPFMMVIPKVSLIYGAKLLQTENGFKVEITKNGDTKHEKIFKFQ